MSAAERSSRLVDTGARDINGLGPGWESPGGAFERGGKHIDRYGRLFNQAGGWLFTKKSFQPEH